RVAPRRRRSELRGVRRLRPRRPQRKRVGPPSRRDAARADADAGSDLPRAGVFARPAIGHADQSATVSRPARARPLNGFRSGRVGPRHVARLSCRFHGPPLPSTVPHLPPPPPPAFPPPGGPARRAPLPPPPAPPPPPAAGLPPFPRPAPPARGPPAGRPLAGARIPSFEGPAMALRRPAFTLIELLVVIAI